MLLIVIAALGIALVVQQRWAALREAELQIELAQLQARLAQSSSQVKVQDKERAMMLRIVQMMQEKFHNELAERTEAETQRHPQ
jgi:hypothetical protein